MKREILALYDGEQEGNADFTRIHRLAELPLNHLGFVLRFHDLRTKLPDPATVNQFRGVLTWFAGPVRGSDAYLAWAHRVSRMNVRYVILGDIGVAANSVNLPAINQLLALAGVRHTGDYVAPTLSTRVKQKDPRLVEFECRLAPPLPDYPVLNATNAAARIGLMLTSPGHDGNRPTVVVALGDKGGYAALNYEFCHQRPPLYQGKWLINPFAFFEAAFGGTDFPIPDTTTVSGRRLYFSRLDKDGWTRQSKIEGFRDTAAMAGEVVVRELIERFRDLPTTIDPHEGSVVGSGRSAAQARLILQRAFAAPNVEALRHPLQAMSSRLDSEYPSISNLAPPATAAGERVVNAPLSDDQAYYRGGPVGENGFHVLAETVTNTEAPRRLKPFNVDYHAFAGEYPALLAAVKKHLQQASAGSFAPISANRFVSIVDGFFTTQIDRVGGATWRISDRGELQTVRFDAVDGREVDLQSSIGVIGQRWHGSVLYVALDESVEPAIVVLRRHTPAHATTQVRLALMQSRWLVRKVAGDACALRFEAQGYGDGAFSWSGATFNRYTVTAERAGTEIWRQTAEADGTGKLDFVLPVDAIEPIVVKINCTNGTRAADE